MNKIIKNNTTVKVIMLKPGILMYCSEIFKPLAALAKSEFGEFPILPTKKSNMTYSYLI